MYTILVLLTALAPVLHTVPDPQEVLCLTTTVYNEARGEPLAGQLRVMDVILNREGSVCEVVSKPHQFAYFEPEINEPEAWERIAELSIMRLGGLVPPQDTRATHFFNPEVVSPDWATEMEPTKWVGQHLFLAEE